MPRLLDLYCGAGGAAMGYHLAGFEVVGIDLAPQPRYPFAFHRMDAPSLDPAAIGGAFDAVHASPPCQAFGRMRSIWPDRDHPDLVAPTRALLAATGLPWVMENVPGAPLRHQVILCGSMFGLGAGGRQLRRHRLFESTVPMLVPSCQHRGQPTGVYGHSGGRLAGVHVGNVTEWREAMGIDWMVGDELTQAIPPAYTLYIGAWLMGAVGRAAT